MRKLSMFFVLSLLFSGQGPLPAVRVETKQPIWKNGRYNLSAITRIGNVSWAPLHFNVRVKEIHKSIQYLIDDFEKANPSLEIVFFQVQTTEGFQNAGEYAHPEVEGVWIYHKEKNKK